MVMATTAPSATAAASGPWESASGFNGATSAAVVNSTWHDTPNASRRTLLVLRLRGGAGWSWYRSAARRISSCDSNSV
eukprot:scaffold6475_cov67-Phaeocystis_antarctica.AAC.5